MTAYLRAQSKTGYDRRYEDKVFSPTAKCIELVDYIGDGDTAGNYYGVYYCKAESFYRAFARATFGGPCIVEIGEWPADQYDLNGEPITSQTINMAAAFRDSDIQILPHGCSRGLVDNLNSTFQGCRQLRSWSPQEMVAAGLAGVKDPAAPRILKTNGLAESAFLLHLAPRTMRRMWAGCEQYSGRNINSISWRNLENERSAQDFAIGARFLPHYLDGIIASLHREFFVKQRVRTPLINVNLGEGSVSGATARMARELVEAGIELEGFKILD